MKQFSLPAALLLGSSVAVADTAATLSPVVVTATRTAQTADETLASVTVITREDIERSQAQMLPEVLRGVPGLTVTNTGGPGKETSIFLRGTNSDHVLVLIDGIKVGSATTGKTAIQDLPLDQIDRIEVVRGPRSSLYGSEAIGGVIQIFTRKGGGELKPNASLTVGSHDTYSGNVGVSGGSEQRWFNFNASGLNSDGFDACRPESLAASAGCFADEPDADGYRNRALSLSAGVQFGDSTELDIQWLRVESDVDYDGYFNATESEQQVLGSRLRTSVTGNWDATVQLGRSWDESDNFSDFDASSRFDTRRDSASWQNDMAFGTSSVITFGLDYQNDKITSSQEFKHTSRDNNGVFAQYQTAIGQQDVIISLRSDDNEQFGEHTTGGLSWGYGFDNGLRLTASYGTAFKAPSFNELYWVDPFFVGNSDLKPEKSKTAEVGLSGPLSQGTWSFNAFRTSIRNLMVTEFDSSVFTTVNLDSARIYGLEAVLTQSLWSWDLNTSLTLLDHEDRETDNRLPRRPKATLNVDLDRSFGLYRVGGTLYGESKRYDDAGNSRSLGGYATLDLRASRDLGAEWRVGAKLSNILDKDYETASYFVQDGRAYYVTLSYQP